jgi:O-methyltransferase domain/Dimerisation domain
MNRHDINSHEPNIPAAMRMLELLSGFVVSQALYVIAELGVATALLGGPRTVEDLASTTGAHADALWRIIRFLAPLGVFRSDGRKVEVTDLGRTLADGPADSVRGTARYYMETHYAPFGKLLHTARTGEPGAIKYFGKPFFEWINESPRLAAIQNAAMAGGRRAARANLLEVYQLPKGETIADIGGADGTLLAELLANRPECRGIVFDLPNVVAKATETLATAGLSNRATVVGGDFFDHVPTADVYVMSIVLHDWDNASAVRILRNIAKAAAPGAHLVLLEMVMPEGDGPHFTKMIDLIMMTLLGGRERTETEWRQLLAEGGFILDRIVSSSGMFSAIEATLG